MNINQANRQCCDLDIREYATNKPWMFADFCNTTTAGFTSDAVYGNKKGAKCIKFENPLNGTMTCTFQVHPFRIYSLFSDGEIETSAIIPIRKTITSKVAGELAITDTPIDGTVYVYADGDIGGTIIPGTFASGKFTAKAPTDIALNSNYDVCYLVSKVSGSNVSVQKISLNNKKHPKNYRITMETIDRNEDGALIPVYITAYKASPQRNLSLSFASTGDLAEITITFDVLEDAAGNVIDMAEIVETV